MMSKICLPAVVLCCLAMPLIAADTAPLQLRGLTVIPHYQSREMRYRREADFSLGARVELYLCNTSRTEMHVPAETQIRLQEKSPDELLAAGKWAWHDFPSAWTNLTLTLPSGALTVWTFNRRQADWGAGTSASLDLGDSPVQPELAEPRVWLSAVTFLGSPANPFPDSLLFHVVNNTLEPLRVEVCRLWLPHDNTSFRALLPQPWVTNLARFPAHGLISGLDRGGARATLGPLPLTYTALEVRLTDAHGQPRTLWACQRIKRDWFDISGGWVGSRLGGSNTLQCEPYLKTLRRMHINTGHIAETRGYTDQDDPDGLYTRYPLKYFNKLQPFERYDTETMLPRIHAVEFLGEPQYGGGHPVPPQDVWQKLAPYQFTRLRTTVTHSEERVWRFYAGLSDFPHYDAYRVTAPSPDLWSKYDRWGGQTIRWGAPLETISEMTRSLRELNRPRPVAYWSQGAHAGWDVYGGRKRTSPTPDEPRLQAYHALASRITSLYWFNLSLASLVKFPDLIEPITRVGREIRMLDDFYLEGDATSHERILLDGKPDWDLDVVAGPRGALLFALDLAYQPDPREKVFAFGSPRDVSFGFALPAYAQSPAEVFRVDSEGITAIPFKIDNRRLELQDRVSRTAIYVAANHPGERERVEARRQALITEESALGFDPGKTARIWPCYKASLTPAPGKSAFNPSMSTLFFSHRIYRAPFSAGDSMRALFPLSTFFSLARWRRRANFPAGICRMNLGLVLLLWVSPHWAVCGADEVRWWLSTADTKNRLAEQPPIQWHPEVMPDAPRITVNPDLTFQTMLGLGSSLEPATCSNLWRMSPEDRERAVERLVNPTTGIGMNLMRICIGTPDFTGDPWYSYNDLPPGESDPELQHFSIARDRAYILPVLKLARQKNSDLLFVASPWSPPGWMKTTGTMVGGSLLPRWYHAYAEYFARFIQAYQSEGIPIYAVTIQNEPGVDRSKERDPKWFYPSCHWTANQERDFIRDSLGPAFRRRGLKTLIWSYDHNYNVKPRGDDPGIDYPRTVLNDPRAAQFVSGVAFHGYAGTPEGMSAFHREFPQIQLHFTEGSVFGLKGGALLIEKLRNWASSYNAWVTILDSQGKPNNGPFDADRTLITFDTKTLRPVENFDFFLYGHFMKFIQRGAARVDSTGRGTAVSHVSFRNSRGVTTLLVVNPSRRERVFHVSFRAASFPVRMPGESVATFVWPQP